MIAIINDGLVIVFGWILVGHQMGAAVAVLGAGLVREATGSYDPSFAASGVLALIEAAAALAIPAKLAATRSPDTTTAAR